jgi:hypothetical protein
MTMSGVISIGLSLPLGATPRHLAAERADLALEIAHAGFAGYSRE